MLPLGAVIPTKNSMPYLPRHVEGLKGWLDLAAEVVVVDSHSTDGTVDFLRANLTHPKLRFTNHPPGLYASWNHGIAQIRSKYTYIATTGDTITRDGLCKLNAVADSLDCDVVISKPTICGPAGQMLPDTSWPIDDIIATLEIVQPRRLHQLEAVVFAAAHPHGALTSSSASGLFRTETMQRHPFPTDFGTAGDGAWGAQHAAEVRWGVVSDRFSTFLLHPTNASAEEKRSYAGARRMDAVLRDAAGTWRSNGTIRDEDLALMKWSALLDVLTGFLDAKDKFDRLRRGSLPWSLNPAAWLARSQRNRLFTRLQELKRAALVAVRGKKSPSPPPVTG